MTDDPNLGCCGYDELAEKPPTTKPFIFGNKGNPNHVAPPAIKDGMARRIYLMGQTTRFPVVNIDRRPYF